MPCEYRFFSKDECVKVTRKLLELASIPTKDIAGVEATPSTNSTTESHAGIEVSSTCSATSHLTRHLTTGSSSATSRSTTGSTTSSATNSTITGGTVELSGIIKIEEGAEDDSVGKLSAATCWQACTVDAYRGYNPLLPKFFYKTASVKTFMACVNCGRYEWTPPID